MAAHVRIPGLAVLVLTLPVLAHADPAATRKGFWWSFGLGYGSARAQCVECSSGDREGSVSGSFRLGGTIGDNLLIGWETGGWLKNSRGWLPTDQYDIRVGSKISLTPELAFSWGRPGYLEEGTARLATDWEQDIVALNLSVTFH